MRKTARTISLLTSFMLASFGQCAACLGFENANASQPSTITHVKAAKSQVDYLRRLPTSGDHVRAWLTTRCLRCPDKVWVCFFSWGQKILSKEGCCHPVSVHSRDSLKVPFIHIIMNIHVLLSGGSTQQKGQRNPNSHRGRALFVARPHTRD